MNFKRLAAAGTALTLAASLAPAVLAAQTGTYQNELFLNGEALDTSAIPAVEAGLIPMRLLSEADGGFADWSEEENNGFFYVADHRILVNFADMSVELDGAAMEGVTATLLEGVTFLPAEALNTLEGLTVNTNSQAEVERLEVTTPNGQPLALMVNGIIEELDMACSMKNSPEELQEYLGIDAANFDQIMAVSPMMIRADTIFVGHYAQGADKEAAKAQFQARLEGIIQSFEHYLAGPYEMAKQGQVVESEDGEWLMLIVSPDNAKAIEMFEAGVKAMNEAE